MADLPGLNMAEARPVMKAPNRTIVLDEEHLDMIAEAAADKAIEKLEARMYEQVGRQFVQKITWMIGAIVVGIYALAKVKGWIK
jgi:hypothetical protein